MSAKPALEILHAGIMSTLQDYGRYGLQHFGITNSGPMDENAYLWANKLLCNHWNAPQIEICLAGFQARFNQPTVIAICGADLQASINQKPINTWQTHRIEAGDVLQFAGAKTGLYTYLAVAGGFNVSPQLGSCSTVMRERLGGLHHNGKKLANADTLDYQAQTREKTTFYAGVAEKYQPDYALGNTTEVSLRFIPNRSENGCDEAAIKRFTQQRYTVSNDISRMGYRLKGEAITTTTTTTNIISQGISTGFIQLPSDGQPIVLMKDRQTIGGYPLLGCVAQLDLAKLSQCQPRTVVRFTAVEIEQLETELIEYLDFFDITF